MNIKVDLSAFAEAQEAMTERLLDGMEKGITQGALQVERAAKENLKGDPRGKHLMSSIHTEVEGKAMGFIVARIGCGAATDIEGDDAGDNFGIYVHEGTGIYGRTGAGRGQSHGIAPWFYMAPDPQTGVETGHWTSGMQANPFLENAYNSEGQKVAQLIAAAIMGG